MSLRTYEAPSGMNYAYFRSSPPISPNRIRTSSDSLTKVAPVAPQVRKEFPETWMFFNNPK